MLEKLSSSSWSVRNLLYLLTAAAVIPAAVLLALSVHNRYEADERDAALSAHYLAQLTADNVQSFLSDSRHVLRKIADRLKARNGSINVCDQIFAQFADLYPHFSNLSQSDPSGSIVCSTMRQPGVGPTFVGDAAWFKQVYATQKFTVGPPYLGPVSNRMVSVLSEPVLDANGKMTGSIQMPIDLAKFRVIPGADKLPQSTVITIIDSTGVVVARSSQAEEFVGKNLSHVDAVQLILRQGKGTGRSTGSQGIERVLGFVPIDGVNWFAVAGISTESVLHNARESALSNMVYGVFTLLMILGVAVYVSKLIARPMASVGETARHAAAGDLNARVLVAGPAEIVDFAVQFNRMLDSIRAAQDNLANAQSELVLLGSCLSHLTDMVIIMDGHNAVGGWPVITFVNQAFIDITGYPRGTAIGRTTKFLHGADTNPEAITNIEAGFEAAEPFRQEIVNYTRGGDRVWIELDMIPIRDADRTLTHWVSIERDVSARKEAEQNIQRLAYSDDLTGLPNRPLLMERINTSLALATRDGLLGILLFVDLDNFKQINDARGHAIGDALLQIVAQRLTSVVGDCATVARIGGDEFVILLTSLSSEPAVTALAGMALADSVRTVISRSYDVNGQSYNSSASIGVTLLRSKEQTAHDLLREADTAMYFAKRGGRDRVAMFAPTMQTEVEIRLALENDLAHALRHKQLSVHVQTQVDQRGQPAGAEFLMRWRHPLRGFVPPSEFVPVAEDTGMIVELGTWMLEQACTTLAFMQDIGNTLPLSVNVSPRQFRQDDFIHRVKTILKATGAPPSQLIFEVTEGLLIDNLADTIDRMFQLVALGIRLSIDDFGTGYSSLAYLHRLPLHEVKIDRSFVRNTPNNVNDAAIVRMILSMAKHLDLQVVAEGVETQEQADFLIANDCNLLQGYLFARPIPLEVWQHSLTSQVV